MTDDSDDTSSSRDDDAITEAVERATYACQDASGIVPTPQHWGAWIYSDAHPAVGGGVGGFVWFESEKEMLVFMREHLVFLDQGIEGRHDVYEIQRTCHSVVDEVTNGSISLRTAMVRLNHAVRRLSVIKWWGRMEDLLVGEEAFPREVRSSFRGEPVESTRESAPIPERDERDFAEFLGTMI
jgi:hypothetical protein